MQDLNMEQKTFLNQNKSFSKFVNLLMINGQKTKAEKILINSFLLIYKKTCKDPSIIFIKGLINISPLMNIKSIRNRGRSYQIPFPLSFYQQLNLGSRWLINHCKKINKNKSFEEKLANVL